MMRFILRPKTRLLLAIAGFIVCSLLPVSGQVRDDWRNPPSEAELLDFDDSTTIAGVVTNNDLADTCTSSSPDKVRFWFRYQGDGRTIQATTVGSEFDTVLTVYQVTDSGGRTEITKNDNTGRFGQEFLSEVQFESTVGTDYLILFGENECSVSNTGQQFVAVSITFSSVFDGANNDDVSRYRVPGCDEALALNPGDNFAETIGIEEQITCTSVAAVEEYCFLRLGTLAFRQWFVYEGEGRSVTISTAGSQFDTRLSVYEGSCSTVSCVESNDDSSADAQAVVTFFAASGTSYFIYADDYPCDIARSVSPGSSTRFVLTIEYASGTGGGGGDAEEGGYGSRGCEEAEVFSAGDEYSTSLTLSEALTCERLPALEEYCFSVIGSAGWGKWLIYDGDGQSVTVSTAGSQFDTRISVYEGTCDTLICVASNDDSDSSIQAEITFFAVRGTRYIIHVDDFACDLVDRVDVGESAEFFLTIDHDNQGQGNDDTGKPPVPAPNGSGDGAGKGGGGYSFPGCEEAEVLNAGDEYGTTLTLSEELTCEVVSATDSYCFDDLGSIGYGNWFLYEGEGRSVTLSTSGSQFDTRISVYEGTCDAVRCLASNDDISYSNELSQVTFFAARGTSYFIIAEDFPCDIIDRLEVGQSTSFSLTLDYGSSNDDESPVPAPGGSGDGGNSKFAQPGCEDAVILPAGDDYVTALSISEPVTCNVYQAIDSYCFTDLADVAYRQWFVYVGEGRSVIVSTAGSMFDTRLSIYEGTCDTVSCVASNDDKEEAPSSINAEVAFFAAEGTRYLIFAEDFPCDLANRLTVGQSAAFSLTVNYATSDGSQSGGASGSTAFGCDTATDMAIGSAYQASLPYGVALSCTVEAAIPSYCFESLGSDAGNHWFSFIGDGREVTISTEGSAFDTRISVYQGTCGALACLANNDDISFSTVQSMVTFQTSKRVSYLVHVDDFPCELAGSPNTGEKAFFEVKLEYADATEIPTNNPTPRPSGAPSRVPSEIPSYTPSSTPTGAPIPVPPSTLTTAPNAAENEEEEPSETRTGDLEGSNLQTGTSSSSFKIPGHGWATGVLVVLMLLP